MAYTDIDKPSDYFETKLYTGTQQAGNITGLDFAPNWVWIKKRTGASGTSNHYLFDSVRGASKTLFSNATNAEDTNTNSLTAFNSDGFSLGNDTDVNVNNGTFVSWNWKAGTSFSNSAGANGASIASTGSVNTTAGFSIVSYQGNATAGATIGHGLGTAPHWIIMKDRSNARDFFVFHQSTGATNRLKLNATNTSSGSTFLNDAAPTSSVYAVDGGTAGNASGANYIAYCFAEKQGYSKFGSYVGNGNVNGSYIHLGFLPAMVICKNSSASTNWQIVDNKRNTANIVNKVLYPDLNNAEDTVSLVDFNSNGFKVRNTTTDWNTNAQVYIYMAFAENPFTTSTGVPTTAR